MCLDKLDLGMILTQGYKLVTPAYNAKTKTSRWRCVRRGGRCREFNQWYMTKSNIPINAGTFEYPAGWHVYLQHPPVIIENGSIIKIPVTVDYRIVRCVGQESTVFGKYEPVIVVGQIRVDGVCDLVNRANTEKISVFMEVENKLKTMWLIDYIEQINLKMQ